MATCLLCPHTVFPLYSCIYVSLYVQISASYRDNNQIELRSTLTASFLLSHLSKSCVSKGSHILKHWGLELQMHTFWRDTVEPIIFHPLAPEACNRGQLYMWSNWAWHGIYVNLTVVKNLPTNAGDTRDLGSIPGLRRSPGGGNGNPLQYSCLGSPMDRGVLQSTVSP